MHLALALLAGSFLFAAPSVDAQVAASSLPQMPSVPTTKVLAIGSLTDVPPPAGVMQHEVPDTVRLFLAGKIDQWYSRKDKRGVVFVMNVTSVEEAHTLLEKLPLGVAGSMKFELIPLGPLSPLGLLLPPATAPAK
jgi:hypothetical protein